MARLLQGATPSPALPACALGATGIEALYASRFVSLPWDVLCQLARQALGASAEEGLRAIRLCARLPSDAEILEQAAGAYRDIMQQAPGLLAEEVEHHLDLTATPLWGTLNICAFAERLHLVTAARQGGDAPRCRALGHALRLHLLRRYLDRQAWPVLEALHILPQLAESARPWRRLNDFEGTYGSEAGLLARTLWESPDRGTPEWRQDARSLLLGALDPRWLGNGRWTTLVTQGVDLFADDRAPSELAAWSLSAWRSASRPPASRARSPIRLLAEYLFAVRGGGLAPTLLRLLRTGLGLFPAAHPSLGRRHSTAPRGPERVPFRVPALRTYPAPGSILIVDPMSWRRGSRVLNFPGVENLLERGSPRPPTEPLVDQLVLRRAVQRLADPTGVWSDRLLDFVRRWTATPPDLWPRVVAALAEIDPLVSALAEAIQAAPEAVAKGSLTREMLALHREARALLLGRIDEELEGSGPRPVFYAVDAFYMHGL